MATATATRNTWLSIQETAAELGIDERTVRRYIDDGALPAARIGGRLIRIKVTDIEELLAPMTLKGVTS